MLILAVDPGLRKSGYCILRDYKIEKSGVLKISAKATNDDAILQMTGCIHERCKMWEMQGYKFDLLVIEKQYLGKNADSTNKTAIVAGAWICAASPTSLIRVAPATWGAYYHLPKKREDKKIAAINIANNHHQKDWTEDEAEAFLMGLWAWQIVEWWEVPL